MPLPILYSFRRCPYAMRARVAVLLSGKSVELREIVLKNKPDEMLAVSPKGTVPVLVIDDGIANGANDDPNDSIGDDVNDDKKVIEESLDVMSWALSGIDSITLGSNLLNDISNDENIINMAFETSVYDFSLIDTSSELIQYNDQEFKYYLDRYKYADRYPEHDEKYYREKGMVFIQALEKRLSFAPFLNGKMLTLDDVAIFPFIRQFAHVDREWFFAQPFPGVITWLSAWLESSLFKVAMKKYKPWVAGRELEIFGL